MNEVEWLILGALNLRDAKKGKKEYNKKYLTARQSLVDSVGVRKELARERKKHKKDNRNF